LLEIAPSYFEHMSNTHNKATALAKIMGFYTSEFPYPFRCYAEKSKLISLVKIHDVHTNEKRSMDLLVMENLFWKQEIDRTFDLKGIGE
jgi:1-phosphatidylinositol-3-phosphate 5-kinase